MLVAKSQSLLIAKFARCSLQKFTHYSLLIAEVSSFKKSLAARCKKFACYSLRNSLVTRCRNCSVQKSLVSHCNIPSILIPKNHASLKQAPAGIIVCLKSTKLDESFSFFNIICFLVPKNSKLFKSTYYAEICCWQNIV